MAIAVGGAVLGIMCAYAVYFNHGFEAQEHYTQMELEVLQADEHYDKHTYHRFQSHRQQSKEHWVLWNQKFMTRRNWSFYVGNVLGVSGLICFAVSVIWFAFAVGS